MRILAAFLFAALVLPAAATPGTVFLVDGRGWGHGVGMSQWGAEGYARHGASYRAILAHYYPHTHIGVANPPDVRVLLAEAQDKVRVGSSAPFLVVDAIGRKLHLAPRDVVVDRRFVLRHKELAAPLRFEPGAQPLRVDGAGYRGDVLVKAKPEGLMAVNVLPLDRYLRGVVPWEVPKGWHAETYRAQSVAARSYTLATLKPGEDYDLYRDERSQMYGGIAAERTETNLAVGSTAGQVLVWRDRIIPAYYFSTSGGRTSSVHDAWPRSKQVPYLVSVSDPYDYLSPHHVWPTRVLSETQLSLALGLSDVRDVRVVENSSGRAKAVRVLALRGWKRIGAAAIEEKLHLGSADFEVHAMTLEAPPARALYATKVTLHGWLRGLGRARLQELTDQGWRVVRHVTAAPDGHFSATVPAVRSTQLRLAYNTVAGATVALRVAPRVLLSAEGQKLRVRVSPRLPLQVQRLTDARWRPVAKGTGTFERALKPGSYRVAVLGGAAYAPAVTAPIAVRVRSLGP
jgi:stage II sporulation protein D